MTEPPSVTCVGLVTLDLQQVVDRLPGRDEKTVSTGAELTVGGPAANAATTAALLGAEATLVTGCGNGPVGGLVRAELAGLGVRLVDLAVADQPGPAVSSVLVHRASGDRSVVSANATGLPVDAGPAGPAVAGAGCVLVDGHHLPAALVAAAAARERRIPVVLDGGSWKDGTDALLPLVDVAVLSADFAVPGGADPLGHARGHGCRVVAVSRGAGAVTLEVEGRRTALAVPRVEVVDTLGAGDVLHGAVAFALAAGADPVTDAEAVLRFATALASLSCAHRGARGWARDPAARDRAHRLVEELRATVG